MKVSIISCSNVEKKEKESSSLKFSRLIEKNLSNLEDLEELEIVNLCSYNISNCIFCGECIKDSFCKYDVQFNEILKKMIASEIVFFVVPFYSVVPSKLTMIFEKLNQIIYTAWIKDSKAAPIFKDKKAGIIIHGGTNIEEYRKVKKRYFELAVKPIRYSLKSVGFELLQSEKENKKAIFGVERYEAVEGDIFPGMVYNWSKIDSELNPLLMEILT